MYTYSKDGVTVIAMIDTRKANAQGKYSVKIRVVFFDVLMGLIGKENISGFSLKSLCDSKGYQHVELMGMLLNYSSEIGSGDFDPDIAKNFLAMNLSKCVLHSIVRL